MKNIRLKNVRLTKFLKLRKSIRGKDFGELNFPWREFKCLRIVFKVALVRTVAKRFIGRPAATAKRYNGTALQTILVALHIYNFKVAFYFY